jgi:hypothetical protein
MTPIRSKLSMNVYTTLSLPVIALCFLALPGLTRSGLACARHEAVEPVALATVGFCITDDHTHDNLSFNAGGAYTFTRCKDGFTLSGTGTVRTSGSVMILTDKKLDRIINARFLTNQKTGRASVTLVGGKGNFQTTTANQTNPSAACGC